MFSEKLFRWYADYGRRLPWRGIDNPYYIWLSEIILQQTRIEQGRAYYEHFVATYPTVEDLAKASEEQVLKSWQGLGYYSRARNLHTAARHVAFDLGSRFPNRYEDILALKGVGRYTAAAIASFAFRLPYPVIDGNVYRFVSRLYGIFTPIGTDKAYDEFERLLLNVMDYRRPDIFNQAMMDFGSLCCKPVSPDCADCIFRQECFAHKEGKVEVLPVKQAPVKIQERYLYYMDIRWHESDGERLLVHQRQAGDIWQGLYEFPLLETTSPIKEDCLAERLREFLAESMGCPPETLMIGPRLRHQLTHRTIIAQFVGANYTSRPPKWPDNCRPVSWEEMKSLPISRLIDRYLSKM